MTCRRRSIASGTPRTSSIVAVMPDVHLAADVCIGVVVGTSAMIYPQAVGGDIGCGMLAVAFDADAAVLDDRGNRRASSGRARPGCTGAEAESAGGDQRTSRCRVGAAQPREPRAGLAAMTAGSSSRRSAAATISLSFQADQDGRLWLMVHSGSRGVGHAIRDRPPGARAARRPGLPRARRQHGGWCRVPCSDMSSGAALRRRQPEGNGRGSGHARPPQSRECAPLVGHGHRNRPQPRVASNATSGRDSSGVHRKGAMRAGGGEFVASCQGRWAARAFTWKGGETRRRCARARTVRVEP